MFNFLCGDMCASSNGAPPGGMITLGKITTLKEKVSPPSTKEISKAITYILV
jgi:hypothetical protein